MSLRPINSETLLRELDLRTAGWGGTKKLAAAVGIEPAHLREIKCGRRRMNQKVASELGWDLKWVRKVKQ